MPRRDCTGSAGLEPMTGRAMGFCNSNKASIGIRGLGFGIGCKKGFGWNRFNYNDDPKDILKKQKAILQERLEVINKQLNEYECEE
ncbi:MAG: DUF5320 domain-containing protein [Caloramator sp.]|nr:DUF5320 domain-containing protein [Caloramator sp.]